MTETLEAPATFEGRPINGKISHYSEKNLKEQHDPSELVAALDALFAFPEVVAVRWTQYTPYFNDGDACTFDVYEARTKLTDTPEEAGDYEDGFITSSGDFPPNYFDTHAYSKSRPKPGGKPWDTESYQPEGTLPVDWNDQRVYVNGVERTDIQAAMKTVEKLINGGHHETILYRKFGDPAEVTVVREGDGYKFDVEYYDHE